MNLIVLAHHDAGYLQAFRASAIVATKTIVPHAIIRESDADRYASLPMDRFLTAEVTGDVYASIVNILSRPRRDGNIDPMSMLVTDAQAFSRKAPFAPCWQALTDASILGVSLTLSSSDEGSPATPWHFRGSPSGLHAWLWRGEPSPWGDGPDFGVVMRTSDLMGAAFRASELFDTTEEFDPKHLIRGIQQQMVGSTRSRMACLPWACLPPTKKE